MQDNKMFSEHFRSCMFARLDIAGRQVGHHLTGIFQNPVPLTKDDIDNFNSSIDNIISNLTNIKEQTNAEIKNGNLVPFEK